MFIALVFSYSGETVIRWWSSMEKVFRTFLSKYFSRLGQLLLHFFQNRIRKSDGRGKVQPLPLSLGYEIRKLYDDTIYTPTG